MTADSYEIVEYQLYGMKVAGASIGLPWSGEWYSYDEIGFKQHSEFLAGKPTVGKVWARFRTKTITYSEERDTP